jgi:hypothetical protein
MAVLKTVKQIRMFYIGGGDDVITDSEKVNAFLREKGDDIIDIYVESNLGTGGDTKDTIMVVYKERV